MNNKYEYRVYDCNSDVCKFIGSYVSLNSAKDSIFFLGNKFDARRYYVIEVYNRFFAKVSKVHYSVTSLYFDSSTSSFFHQICLDYGKCEKHNCYSELKK